MSQSALPVFENSVGVELPTSHLDGTFDCFVSIDQSVASLMVVACFGHICGRLGDDTAHFPWLKLGGLRKGSRQWCRNTLGLQMSYHSRCVWADLRKAINLAPCN